MKTKILLLLFLTSLCLYAEQKIISIPCKDGSADTGKLAEALKQGWKVVVATPVADSDSISLGKPKQSYTASIVYIVERDTPPKKDEPAKKTP